MVASLNKMMKNNAGYDLKQLFIGAEGTLGVVTRAVLQALFPKPRSIATGLVALQDYDAVLQLPEAGALRASAARSRPSR